MMIVSLILLGAFAFYVMNPEERSRALQPVLRLLRILGEAAARGLLGARYFLVALLGRKPWAVAGLAAMGVLIVTVALHGVYLRSLTDIKPEIERLIAIEAQTSKGYEAAVAQFKLGAISADALAKTIKRNVLPELQGIRLRLKSLDRVPLEHRPILLVADEYLRLRNEAWRLRADALEKRSMAALRKADRAEQVSLEAFGRVRLDELQ